VKDLPDWLSAAVRSINNMIAYHFLHEKYALDAIENQYLKLSLIDDLNDPFELLAADLPDKETREEALKFKKHMVIRVGILCFSRNWKNPLLWSHYADKHKGVALEFKIKDDIALPVNYRQNRFPINLKEIKFGRHVTRAETEGLWATKFSSWKYEEEIRIICTKDECLKKGDLYFKSFDDEISLLGIVLGPLSKLTLNAIREKLPQGKELGIIKSRLAFRSFNIVAQRDFKKVLLKK
jgi:hypothetical protein